MENFVKFSNLIEITIFLKMTPAPPRLTNSLYYCHTCQQRFQSTGADMSICSMCHGEFIEAIPSENANSPIPIIRPIATFAITSPPTTVIRITVPVSASAAASTSTNSINGSNTEGQTQPTTPSIGGLPGFVQSILGIFTPSTQRGNGSSRRRTSRDQDNVNEDTRSSPPRPRLISSTTTTPFGAIPASIATTFTTTLSEEDLSSPEGLQQFLISLFTQVFDTMTTTTAETDSNSDASNATAGTSSTAGTTSAEHTSQYTTESSSTETSESNIAPSSLSPNTPGEMIRLLLQQVLTGPLAMQWIRVPAIPELLGDYVFGDRAFDDVISELMEQAAGQRAPPPADQSAINALERVPYTSGTYII